MPARRTTLLLAVAMAALLALGACAADPGTELPASGNGTLAVGDAAPDFTLPVANAEGDVSLSQYRGESPVVLVFYRSFFCTFCVRQVNEFNSNYEKFRERGVEVVAISSDDLTSVTRRLIRDDPNNYQFPILYTSVDPAVPSSYGRIGGWLQH